MARTYPSDWNKRRRKVYKRDNYTCQNCGAKGGPHGNTKLHAHHVLPKSKGGSDSLSNLKTLCADCHNSAHSGKNDGIPKPPNRTGRWKIHALLLIMTFGTGNILYFLYCNVRASSKKWKFNKIQRKEKHGGVLIHLLLLATTFGIGNILYLWYKGRKRKARANA